MGTKRRTSDACSASESASRVRKQRKARGMSPGPLSRNAWRVLLILAAACNARADRNVVRAFSDTASSQFNHLAVDRNTGRVYVGAVNRIYQLSPELELDESVVTGPANDSASDRPTKPTDSANKALVIDYAASRLITCWSVEGRCSVRNLSSISHDVQEAPECVVSNDAAASTVAFVASGPTKRQVLYVGVTETGNSCGAGVPAVSSRSLEDNRLFMIDRSGTRMFVNSLVRERYPINYVHGFSSEGFSYFLTTQLRGVNSDTYYSKLVRVCHDDENYYSYTEIPISCSGKDIDYNLVQAAFVGKPGSVLAGELGITAQHDVLYTAFSQSESTNSNKPSNLSALCVYSLKAIRRKFTENIKTCFSGNGSRGLDFISPAHACRRTEIEAIDEDFCGSDVNTPLGGEQAVEAVPVAMFEKRLTAVAATVAGEYTVVFAGTAEGHLQKIVVENATSATEYGDIVVDEGSAVNKDLFLDSQSFHLYAMTEHKVSKVKVQKCSVYKSCSTCLGAKDPFCGWCSHEDKCSLRSDCQDAAMDPLYWLSYRSGRCTVITQVTPNQLQRTTTGTLDLVIENLPTLNGQVLCAFTAFDRTLITNASRKPDGVNCPTPSTDTLPLIPAGQNHFTAQLSVRTTQGPDIVATKFKFFDCNTFSSCTQCVSSSFPCDWCVDGHRCTHDTAENCRNDILVTGITRIGPIYRAGPNFCPSIIAASDGSNEILVPFGVKKAIRVKVHIIGQFIVQTRFVCRFDIESRVTHVNAQLLADTIYCDVMEFTYTSRPPNMTASLAVIWGGSKPLDNPNGTHILIYRCEEMADSCGTCLALSERFACGWCQESGRCEAREQCDVPSAWLNGTQTCPNTTEIHSKNVTSFDCNAFSSCTQCVSSSFPCDWRVDGHRCTHDTAENCRNDILVTGATRIGPIYRAGPNFCPSIKAASDGSNEILVPFGVKKAIRVKVHIIGQFIVQTRFVCRFDIEGRVTHVNAQLLADTIYCDVMEFTYTSRAPNMTASLAVIWGGSKPLDNPNGTHILIYRCEEMADSCGTCLALSERFACGWCQETRRCQAREQCDVPSAWLNGTQTCPNTTEIHSKNVTSFVCNAFSSCTQCVSSSFPCDWCVDGHRCTHDTAENCRNDIVVTGVTRIGPSYRAGPNFCPSITAASDGSNEILVPFGVKKAIRVKVHIIGQFIVQTRFVCRFDIEGRVTHVNAQLLADTIYCDVMEFTYTSRAPNMTASLAVIWGGSKPLDNPNGTHILIYRCEEMADSCGTCLAVSERFACGWCQETRRCQAREQCDVPSAWLKGTQTCPNTTEIHSKNVTSFVCNAFSSCTQCVSSSFPCDWCVDGHRCTHDTAENCRNDIVVTGVTRIGPSYRAGPNFCPSITAASDGSNEILVPFGVKEAIRVKVHIIGQFIVQTRFVCRFDIEGRVTHVNAQLLADTIYCDVMEFTYTSRAPNMTASLAVIWGGSKPLDNPNGTHILIYRCEEMADSCGTCLALSERFACGWCQETRRCQAREQCDVPSAWLNGTQTCPNTTEIHSKNVTSFVCNAFSSCTQCVSSSFPCDWCVDGHRCTHDTAENCRNDIVVTGVTRIGPSYRAGPNFCPSITAASDGSNEILVPFGVKKAIRVKVHIIGQFIVQTRFVCRFDIEGRVTHVYAQLLADTIYCEATEFTYTSRAPNMTASLAVIWGGSKPLDNPNGTHILIYRCEEMADSCGTCLTLSARFGCGWCQESGRCEAREQCDGPSAWLNGTQSCPNTTEIHSKNVTSFDCNAFSSCTQCVSSSFPCDWCVDGHRCTHDTAENCRNDIVVTGVTRIGPIYRAGPNFCPSITAASDGSNEILVPFGVKKAIRVKVHIIGQFIVQTRFVCRFDIEGRVTHVYAQLLADTIYCEATEFTYTSRAPNMTASLAVIWGGSKPLDNPNGTHILIYRCEEMADSCGTCLTLSARFGCGWCQESGRCEAREQCDGPSAWLNGTQSCPNTTEIHSKNVTSFDCNAFSSCTQCVSSSFPCDWCVDGHRCTHDTAENCRNDIVVTGVTRIGPIYRAGPNFCPSITAASDGSNEILVPFGVKKAIRVKVHIIGQFIVQTRFVCRFDIEGRVTHVYAQLLADTIFCDAMEFTYTSRAPNMTASLAVIWGGSKPLDNPNGTHILIYRCEEMADSCGKCLALSARFGCGWCQESGRCEAREQCDGPSAWLNGTQSCPNTTQIHSKNVTSFDCDAFSSCTQCVSSSFPCDWCVDGHRCTHDTAKNCRNDILVTGITRIGPIYRAGPNFCPSIIAAPDGSNEIVAPFGVKKAIRVKVHIIGQFIVQTRFVCRFDIEGRVTHVYAQLLADTIFCDAMEFTYTSRAPNMTASLAVNWGGSKPLDNPNGTHILIYRCEEMADSCVTCLALSERFACGWCQESGRCEAREQCDVPSAWLNGTQTCPNTTEIHSKNVTSFVCNAFSSCTQCVSSSFPCDWCVDGHRCTHDTAENCRNDIVVTGVTRIGPSYRAGPNFCPSITAASDGSNEILVPFGVKEAIRVKVHIIGQFIVQTRFVCRFDIEGRVTHVNAQLLADTIYCDVMEFTYTSRAPNMTASLAVIWGGSKPLDNPNGTHILIYRCEEMADSCGTCLALSERFACGWCQETRRCQAREQCDVPSAWLNGTQTCPNTTEIHSKNVTSFVCNAFSSCTQCVSSSFPCDWCVDGHRCTHDTAENCRNDIVVTGVTRIGPSYRAGPNFCPSITAASDGSNEILVPFGVKKAIRVKVHIIGQFIVQTRFVCRFDIEGRVTHVYAQLLADTIYCEATEFTYTSRAPNMTASLAVIWGGSKPLDNPNGTHILIYRCEEMADSCGTCLTLSARFGCGWCQESGRCEAREQCDGPSAWLNGTQSCPNTTEIHSKNVTSFDCNAFSSCTQCVSSSFPCDWCVDGHRCTHDTAENCRNDIVVTGVTRIGPIYRAGPNFCPSITAASDGSNEILVPFGVKKAIRVKVHIIGQFIVQTRFVCRFDIEGRVTHVYAQLLADTIFCDAMEFTYTSRAPNMTASLAVIWGGSKPLDNPNGTHILIYRCEEMADSCGKCLALSARFGCGWCQESGRCEAREQCDGPSAWLNGTQSCPNTTQIHSKNVTSFDCDAFSSCTQCVSSSFPCDWCVDGHRCTHDTAKNCRNDILVTGITRIGPIYRAGPNFCPSIIAAPDGSNEIVAPFGVKKAIRVKVHIIGQFIVQTRFVCRFDIEGRVTHVYAQLLADTIFCDAMEFTYTSRAPNMTASLAVNWGGSKPLDNPNGTHILIYRCEEMADSCVTCLALSERFACGWCQESGRCEAREQCDGPSAWLNGTQTCPNTTETHSKNVTSFDCNAFSSCTQCVSSSFPCDWCVDGHRCTHDTAENCRNDIVVTGVTRIGPIYRAGPNFCPSITAASDGSNEILVPFGVKKAIRVKVHIIGQFIVQTRFVCRFDIEGRVTHVYAQLLADTIYCEATEFTYTSRAPNMTASLAVIWGGSKPLDNPNGTHILIYRCEEMANSCGTCLTLSARFGCGWCQESGRCEAREQCDGPSAWLNGTQSCPNTTEIHSKNVTSFDCNAFSSCTQCVSSSFPCDWCVDGHRCTHDTAENCRNDIVVTGVTRIGPIYRAGPNFCPSITAASDGSNEILVPFGVKKAIRVKVHIIGQFIVQTRFVCRFDIEGRVTHMYAQLLADTIFCDAMEFTYTSRAPNMTASLAVIWGGSKPLDNPNGTHILIYRCEEMADSCVTCLALSERFACGWCQESGRCEAREQCDGPSAWLNGTQTCPNTTEIHSKNVTSFDCNAFSSCTQCVSSSFPCDWCVDGHRCTHDTAENCRNDIVVTGVTRIGPIYRAGPNFCPSIIAASDGSNEILVPFGVKKAIRVKVHIIGQFIVQTRFVCRFDIEGRVTHVNAQLLADTIYCDVMEFTYTSRAPNMTALLAVIWGGSKPLDNPNGTHLLIYRCEEMADRCGTCLALSERFACGWCQESGRCEAREQCGVPSAWLNGTQTCPNTTEIHYKNVTSFDCNAFSSCTQCVSSSFPCDWCVDGHRCTDDTAENCRNDILVTGITRIGPIYRAGPNFCPSIIAASDGSNEILVPFGVKKAIRVKVHIIGQFIVQTRFVCRFDIEGRVTHVNAQLLADTIYCDVMEFTYTSRAPNMTASLAVIWGGSKPLDNPNGTHILIYRCEEMADSCGTCLALSERFACGWCQESGRCEAREQCGVPSAWLNGTQDCPTAEINSAENSKGN